MPISLQSKIFTTFNHNFSILIEMTGNIKKGWEISGDFPEVIKEVKHGAIVSGQQVSKYFFQLLIISKTFFLQKKKKKGKIKFETFFSMPIRFVRFFRQSLNSFTFLSFIFSAKLEFEIGNNRKFIKNTIKLVLKFIN